MVVIVEACGLTVRRGRRVVLSDVNVSLTAGAGVWLAGANGSGKTSLLRVLAGLAHSPKGTLERHGSCAFVPEKVTLAPALRCGEWLRAMRDLRELDPVDWPRVVAGGGLDDGVLARRVCVLSKGMTQRVALLEALQSHCALLLLDEPFSGLDEDGRQWLGEQIAVRRSAGAAVLLTDHSGAAADRLALAGVLRLRDGACEQDTTHACTSAASMLSVLATHPDGRRMERTVHEHASDELLRELLRDRWHVDRVRP